MPNVCPICNNSLRQYDKDFYVCEVCETYFDKNENIVLTEQEWLQTATTEQLVEAIYNFVWCSSELWQRLCCSGDGTDKESDLKIVREWLKQPHTNKE